MIEKKLGVGAIVLFSFILLAGGRTVSAAETTQNKSTSADITFSDGGALTLDAVSQISFGSQTVIVGDATYNTANVEDLTMAVSDGRGTSAGWRVTAQLGNFKDASAANSLKEAIIKLDAMQLTSNSIAGTPSMTNVLNLESGAEDPTLISSAAAGKGDGRWEYSWGLGAKLLVHEGAATKGTHTGTITWSLVDAP